MQGIVGFEDWMASSARLTARWGTNRARNGPGSIWSAGCLFTEKTEAEYGSEGFVEEQQISGDDKDDAGRTGGLG